MATPLIRRSLERGFADHGWLRSYHTFSFAEFHDPAHMGFGPLRVINEDRVAPSAGFPTHPHRDMEILTYVLSGGLEHQDSMGNGSIIRPGEVQVMSAGTGVTHSEFNASRDQRVHLLQVWIFPRARNLPPRYEQAQVGDLPRGELHAIAGPQGSGSTVLLEADARVWVARLAAGEAVEHASAPGRGVWLQVARGGVRLDGVELAAGDGAAIESMPRLRVEGQAKGSEVLLFDLA